MSIVVYGADYSVYTRIVRMALAIKGTEYQFEPVDIFSPDSLPDGYADEHPFQKVPALRHDAFHLFETGAICRYIDEVFPAPSLFSNNAQENAHINQIVSIMDNYVYRCWVWDIAVERLDQDQPDETKIEAALPRARTCLASIEALTGHGPGLIGTTIALADLYSIAMMHYFVASPEGASMLIDYPRVNTWWHTLSVSDWAINTAPPG